LRNHAAGLWDDNGYTGAENWCFEEGNLIAVFWADALVAQGLFEAEPTGDGQFKYWRAPGN
jgi:hypothetical protein